jgi:hypothetical protein
MCPSWHKLNVAAKRTERADLRLAKKIAGNSAPYRRMSPAVAGRG